VEEIWELKAKIEALLVAADRSVTVPALALCLDVTEVEVDEALREFEADLMAADRGIQIQGVFDSNREKSILVPCKHWVRSQGWFARSLHLSHRMPKWMGATGVRHSHVQPFAKRLLHQTN
jgi:hypothetical protein